MHDNAAVTYDGGLSVGVRAAGRRVLGAVDVGGVPA